MFTMFYPILSKRFHPDPLGPVRIILVVYFGPELPQIGPSDLTQVHTMNNYYKQSPILFSQFRIVPVFLSFFDALRHKSSCLEGGYRTVQSSFIWILSFSYYNEIRKKS